MPPLPASRVLTPSPQAVAQSLRRLARQAEPPWWHAEVARRMAARLPLLRHRPDTWLAWWPWLGGGAPALAAVRQAWPQAQALLAEPDDAWCRRHLPAPAAGWMQRWRRHSVPASPARCAADFAPGCAGMVWANMVWPWASDPTRWLARWQELLAPGGMLMMSTHGPDSLRELQALYTELGWPPPAPLHADMHDLGDLLLQHGWAEPVVDQETVTLHWSGPQALLAELRGWGGNLHPHRHPGLRTPRWQRELERALQRLRGPDGRLALTIEIVYAHAWKGAARAQEGVAQVSLADVAASLPSRRPRG